MQKENIYDYLEQLGLDKKEADVYLALLELGESQIVPISNKAKLPRTTTYHILERLRDHKLIEIIQKKTRRLYSPYPPRNLITLLSAQKDQAEEKLTSFRNVLPDLTRLYQISPFQPKVRFFQDQEIRQIYEEILETASDENWYVGETTKIVNILGERYLQGWIKRRVAKGIRSKSIRVEKEEMADPLFLGSKEYLRTVRYAPPDFKCPTHILIYGDNVAFITTGKENFGLVISSRETATSMRNWFMQLWKVSK